MTLISSEKYFLFVFNQCIGYNNKSSFGKATGDESSGWNLVSLDMSNTETGTDRNISVSSGWNLIGYSSNVSINLTETKFINSSGTKLNWSDAVSEGKVQAYLKYYENGVGRFVSTPDLNMHDYALRSNTGYWLYANEDGNFSLPGAGGTLSGQTYAWNSLKFYYSGTEKNVTEADDAGWVFMEGFPYMYYYDVVEEDWDMVCGSAPSPCDKTTFSSWEGVFIWSNYDDVIMIRS